MKELIAYFPKSSWMKMAFFLVLEQGLVAGSTYALIRASATAATDPAAAFPWVLVFLCALSAPYVPGVFARRELESAIQAAYRAFLGRAFPEDGRGIRRWARRDRRETFLATVTGEALGQLRQVAATIFDLAAVILNVVLNLAVLGYHFHPVIAAAFALGTGAAFLIFRRMMPRIDRVAEEAQLSRTALFAKLQRSWDNMFAAHAVHRRAFRDSLDGDLGAHRARAVGAVTLSELVSVGTTFAIMAPVLVAAVALLRLNPTSAFLLSMLATLPRQFQIMGNLQVFLSYMTALTGIAAQARQVVAQSRVDEVGTEGFVRAEKLRLQLRAGEGGGRDSVAPMGAREVPAPAGACEFPAPVGAQDLLEGRLPEAGRLVIRGPNGAGKSSLLLSVRERLGDQAYYLPAHLDFWIDGDGQNAFGDVRNASSGEKILRTLEYAEARGLPRVLLLDEWDANLDAENRARIAAKLEALAGAHLIVEVRHHA